VKRRQKGPSPEYHSESREHKYLHAILGELRTQEETSRSMNQMVQIMGIIVLLSAIGSCLLAVFGPGLPF